MYVANLKQFVQAPKVLHEAGRPLDARHTRQQQDATTTHEHTHTTQTRHSPERIQDTQSLVGRRGETNRQQREAIPDRSSVKTANNAQFKHTHNTTPHLRRQHHANPQQTEDVFSAPKPTPPPPSRHYYTRHHKRVVGDRSNSQIPLSSRRTHAALLVGDTHETRTASSSSTRATGVCTYCRSCILALHR